MDAVYVLPSSSERGSGCPHVRPPQVAHDFIAFLTSLPGSCQACACNGWLVIVEKSSL